MNRPRWPRVFALALAASVAPAACARPAALQELSADGGCAARTFAQSAADEIRWRVPASREDRASLAPWCAAVGAPVLAEGGVDARTPLDSLAVITWNVHGGGGDISRFVGDLRAGDLTNGMPVQDFVLLLQEAHRSSPDLPHPEVGRVPSRVEANPPGAPRLDVVRSARALGLALYYVPSMRNGRDAEASAEDRGNAILSTRPLSSLEALELPFEAQRRVAIGAVVQGTGAGGARWQLRLVNAHLDTRSTGLRAWASGGAGRTRQALALARAIPSDIPVVVGGDLNTWSLSYMEDAIAGLRAHFPDTPAPIQASTFRTGWGFARRLDHLFFRLGPGWTARQQRVSDRYGSDHHPLLSWVRPGSAADRLAGD